MKTVVPHSNVPPRVALPRKGSRLPVILTACLFALILFPQQVMALVSVNIGGNITGLEGDGVTLELRLDPLSDLNQTLERTQNGDYFFDTLNITSTLSYEVVVVEAPDAPSQSCTVENAEGIIEVLTQTIDDVDVTCVTDEFTIGGTVSGLAEGTELVLRNNDEELTVVNSGSFTFQDSLLDLSPYDIEIVSEPTEPSQSCSITNGSGVLSGRDVNDVEISCEIDQFSIGGTVTGLADDAQVVLQNNGGDDLVVNGNEPFTFTTELFDLNEYEVTVLSEPTEPSQSCAVTNASGVLSGANVTDVDVTCVTDTFSIGGTINGLDERTELVLQNNGGDDLVLGSDGDFAFGNALEDLSSYNVTILNEPTEPSQSCAVSNASGALSGANVTDVEISCITDTFSIGGTVSGLAEGAAVVLQNNSGDDLPVSSDGDFTFPTELDDLTGYEVTILSNPTDPEQVCSVQNASGLLSGSSVTDVEVTCADELLTVGFDSQGGSSVEPISQPLNTTVTAPEGPVLEGYSFEGWNTLPDGTGTTYLEGDTFTLLEELVLYAQWELLTFTITATSNDGGSVSPVEQLIDYGEAASFTIIPDEGYEIGSVTGCGGSLEDGSFVTELITVDCLVEVIFEEILSDEDPFTVEFFDSAGAPLGGHPVAVGETLSVLVSDASGAVRIAGDVIRGGDPEALIEATEGVLFDPDVDVPVMTTLSEDSFYFRVERGGVFRLAFMDADDDLVEKELEALPQVGFTGMAQPGTAGEPLRVRVRLYGEPAEYPVRVPYEISNPELLETSDLGATGEMEFRADDDAMKEWELVPLSEEGIVEITLGTDEDPDEVLPGSLDPYRIELRPATELSPRASMSIEQHGASVADPVVDANDDIHLRVSEGYDYDWSESDPALGLTGLGEQEVSIPSEVLVLNQGEVLFARVRVSDIDDPQRSVILERPLHILNESPQAYTALVRERLSAEQITVCEQTSRHEVCAHANEHTVLSVPRGYHLLPGMTAHRASFDHNEFGLAIQAEEDLRDAQGGELLNFIQYDPEYESLGFTVDFRIDYLVAPGEIVPVVIPLPEGERIPDGAVWRKWTPDTGWHDFVENDHNQLASAPRHLTGDCPWVGSGLWTPGLDEGDHCIRLMLEDGGPNDSDGRADGTILDPGHLAQGVEPPEFEETAPKSSSRSGSKFYGCSLSGQGKPDPTLPVFLMLALIYLWQSRSRAGTIRRVSV